VIEVNFSFTDVLVLYAALLAIHIMSVRSLFHNIFSHLRLDETDGKCRPVKITSDYVVLEW